MNRILLNEKQRIRRRARRFVDLNYSQRRLSQSSQQVNSVPTEVGVNSGKLDQNQQLSESIQENVDHIGDVGAQLLSFLDEDVFDVLSSDSSDDEDEYLQHTFDLKKALAEWVINAKIPAYHVDKLLKILRNIAPGLPKCCKTLCKTPRKANIIEMDNGHYLDVGLRDCLNRFLSNNNFDGDCISIDIGVDGVGVSKSSTSDIWPILVSVVGYKDILMPGAFHGTKKPSNVNHFLQRFVNEYNELSDGFCYNNKTYSLHIRAIVADIPARTFILDSIGHTGYSSCTKCTIKGERIFNTMCFPGFDFELRSDASVRNRDDEHHHHSMEPTMVESLPVNLVDDVVVETMHCVYLGLQKQMLRLWVLARRESYSMTAANIRKLSFEILNISWQLPNEFNRFPRPLEYLKRYKATEFRQLLLYTLPVLLEGKIDKAYYDHFLKLHCAMRILCDPVQCIVNNELADKLLKAFVRDFPGLYGREKVTFNCDSLLHIPSDVKKKNAPVEDCSAFKFENYLQYVKSLPRSGYKVLEQMHNRICEKNSIDNYLGDFKAHPKNDRFMKNSKSLYKKVYVFNMILSVEMPDNYVLIEKEVHKIEEISKNSDGNFTIKCRIVQELNPLYCKPISSMDVNVFVGGKENLSEPYQRIVCKSTKKCAALAISNELLNICDTYFRSKVSPFYNCFATVDSLPFYDMCLDMGSNSITDFTHNDHPAQKGACAVAFAYMESCTQQNLPLRIPEICLHCNLVNGSYVAEGSIFEMRDNDVPKTTDVVFIVEASPCNHNLPVNKNIPSVITALEKAFGEVGLRDVRYAVVAFGGSAPFENAHSIVYNNQIFTDSHNIRHHFDHIKTNQSDSSDISRAIKVASELVFRPGASKTFILMPCSNCNVSGMHFDYSTVLLFFWEHNINLHIFMNGNFETKKPRNENKIFGFDNAHAYTNNYLKESIGNKDLRLEIILPKNTLGFCMVWALETNGTIFNANKLKTNSRTPIKKLAPVFAKRVANSAIPSPCQICECTGENNGIAYMTCTRCDFPNEFEEEDVNAIFDEEELMGGDEDAVDE